MGNACHCGECIDSWVALEPIITCLDPSGCFNVSCCRPEPLPPLGQDPGYAEICCTRCRCFDGTPIYIEDQQILTAETSTRRLPSMNQIQPPSLDYPPPCLCCMRAGQIACCPLAGCCLGACYNMFNVFMVCTISYSFCRACCWSSTACLGLCHTRQSVYSQTYTDGFKKYCRLCCILCVCCPLEAMCGFRNVCSLVCKDRISSFQEINKVSHTITDHYKKSLGVGISEPGLALKSFRP